MRVIRVHKDKEPRRVPADIKNLVIIDLDDGGGFSYFEEDGGPPPRVDEEVWVVKGEFGKPGCQLMWVGRKGVLVL